RPSNTNEESLMPLKAILVGLGSRAKSWLDVCRANPDVELAGFVEPVADNVAAREWGVDASKIRNSLTEAIASLKADFVVDVTPPAVHEAVALEAFKGGLHVLGEKPISDNLASARRMAAAGSAA